MKKILISFISLIFIIFLSGCNYTSVNRINEVTGLDIPEDTKIIYSINDNIFMHGRLAQYYVLEFNDNPNDFLINNNFIDELPNNFKEKFDNIEDYCYALKREDIKNKYYPNFENDNLYLYLENKDIYLIYDNNSKYLIIFVTAQ